MVLAEGAGIFGLVSTCIAFYSMVSNGVTLIHQEIKDSEHYKTDVKTLIDKTGRQERRLQQWKKDWFVYDGIDESFYRSLWGGTEYATIQTQLESLAERCGAARKELATVLESTQPATGRGLWQQVKAKVRKAWFIKTRKRVYLSALLSDNTEALDAIAQASKDGWHRHDDHPPDNVDTNSVKRFAIAHLLAPVASKTTPYADYLWLSSTSNREALTSELDLDIFGTSHATTRAASESAIASAAAGKRVQLTILTRQAGWQAADMNRICVRPSESTADSQSEPWIDALRQASSKTDTDPYSFRATDELDLHLFRSAQPLNPAGGNRRSLRDIQSGNQPPRFENNNLLGMISKLRVAFELSQACFLFYFNAHWSSRVCSCRVRRGTPADYGIEGYDESRCDFTLLLSEVEHEPSPWATMQWENPNDAPAGCWGEANHGPDIVNPLRRLAVLLVEVTLGRTVLAAAYDAEGRIGSIDFVESQDNRLQRNSVLLTAVLDDVLLAMGSDMGFRTAVHFCATTPGPQGFGDAAVETFLRGVYIDAVYP
ncbi:hypothetical protein AYL99_06259 [Fonsecaea erecta]|uniref:Uncharacterized protein n=1 Tax=Fonsecaea erecta TaxID=1367422 RepID=A0A178ZH45_9EURO|nr:hypothetical protein AYL99_06259 [Fonsecaea erecta]OAP58962.1 hypothetical protein AYL99_06259 [Fonsecaea erecta]